MTSLILSSPSKVNLILEIKGKRKDGFHELKTVMHSLALSDQLVFSSCKKGIKVKCSHPDVPENEGNLVYKAAAMLASAYKIEPNVKITIKKKIPVAAGMGGGSSNAATALLGLVKFWGIKNNDKILGIAKQLGSDVPFFLHGGCMLGTGRGERVFPWPACPGLPLVIVNPGIRVSTAEIYKNFKFGLTINKACINMMRRALKDKNALKIGRNLFNHLADVTERRVIAINLIKEELLSLGAAAAMMTGSGPTVFGFCPTMTAAKRIVRTLKGRYAYVAATQTTASREG